MFACVIRNPGLLKSVLKESGIPLIIGIRNPDSPDKESEIQYLDSCIHCVKSRIQDCLGLPDMGPLSSAAQRTQKGMARVSVEIQKRVIEPLRRRETRGATC